MPQPAPYADEHIPVGTPAFFSALLAHIEDSAYGQGLPIDTVVLQSILLCFISGDKHLLLRTSEEDVPLVLRIVTAVSSSCLVYQNSKGQLADRSRIDPFVSVRPRDA